MAAAAGAVGYECKWPWNANCHLVCVGLILQHDDLLIYLPICLSRSLSFPMPPLSSWASSSSPRPCCLTVCLLFFSRLFNVFLAFDFGFMSSFFFQLSEYQRANVSEQFKVALCTLSHPSSLISPSDHKQMSILGKKIVPFISNQVLWPIWQQNIEHSGPDLL